MANVLSTSTGTSPAPATTRAMSMSSSVGFAGDSMTTRPVSLRIASETWSMSVQVTVVPSSPLSSTWSVPPYSGRSATMCGLPAVTVASRHAVSAAIPVA